MDRETLSVVVDTNVFVAAGFHPGSAAAKVLRWLREGRLSMAWCDATRRETQMVLETIPPLSWANVASLFRETDRFAGEIRSEDFPQIPDPADRKFAALARATGSVLISQDRDLLGRPQRLEILVLSPREFFESPWQRALRRDADG
jgi:predicted nucleic acid-binding protein